jgi:hypothetical protein
VFVSSVGYGGNELGGLSGADAKCQALATAAKLQGTFKAWLSDSKTDAASRITTRNQPYILVDGTLVASDWKELTSGFLLTPIDKIETGAPLPTPFGTDLGVDVWTNTNIDGTKARTDPVCGDWTTANPALFYFIFGDASSRNPYWTHNEPLEGESEWPACSSTAQASIYCFED